MRGAPFLLTLITKSGRIRRPLTRRHLRARGRRQASRPLRMASALTALPLTAARRER